MKLPNFPGRVSYHHSLGRFIDRFAKVEGLAKELLYQTAGLDPDIGRILLNGQRADGAKKLINTLREAKGVEPDPILDRAFGQLTVITGVRNIIVHNEPQPHGATEFVTISNERSTKPGNETSITFSPDLLEIMVDDLWTISFAIQNAMSPSEGARDRALAPWRYTPNQPTPRPKRSPPSDQAQ